MKVPLGAARRCGGITTRILALSPILVVGGQPTQARANHVDISGTEGILWKGARARRTPKGRRLGPSRATLCREGRPL